MHYQSNCLVSAETNRPNREPIVTVVVVPVRIVRIEVQVVSVVRIARIERRRPVVAVRTGIVKVGTVAITGSRKETPKKRRLPSDFYYGKNR